MAGFNLITEDVRPRPCVLLHWGIQILNGLNLGMGALEVGMTQHCIANHQCREGNPLMPSSLAGQIGVDSALVGYGALPSYKLKKRQSKMWWLAPTTGIVAHGIGAATGFAHR
jgi:hypothetical protein